MIKTVCKLCGSSSQISLSYDGEMRSSGQFDKFNDGIMVFRCSKCNTEFLDSSPNAISADYEEGYWKDKKGIDSLEEIEKAHIKACVEAESWIDRIGLNRFKGKRVLDLGAGTGAFLNVIKSEALSTVAVEMDRSMKSFIDGKVSNVYSSLDDAIAGSELVDVVVSFDVFEHLVDPVSYLKDIKKVLKKNGQVIIGVPNQKDFYKDIVTSYKRHFYHVEHLWYFSLESLKFLAEESGFYIKRPGYLHKYTFMNIVNWLKLDRPTGNPPAPSFYGKFDSDFQVWLEENGVSSHVYVIMELD
jgi:SAM-dependent methyltransferase